MILKTLFKNQALARGFCPPWAKRPTWPIYKALARGFCAPGTKLSTLPVYEALARGFSPLRSGCAPGTKLSTLHYYKALARGFSLVEVVLALGVIAFALVGIMGLFPVAMRSAQESQRETRATLIAQQIFSDLRASTGTNRLIVRGPSATNASWLITNFCLAGNTNLVLSYDASGIGRTDQISTDAFDGSIPDAVFLASVAVDTNTGIPNLSRVQATVEAPAAAPSAKRTKYTFVTLMNY